MGENFAFSKSLNYLSYSFEKYIKFLNIIYFADHFMSGHVLQLTQKELGLLYLS